MARQPPLPPRPIPEARRSGAPPHVPTEKDQARVTAYTGGGIENVQIARMLGISKTTLRKHYKVQLEVGKATIDGVAISALVRAMQQGGKEAVTAAKFWATTQMGYTERLPVEEKKPGDMPMRVVIEFVGDPAPPTINHEPARPRVGFNAGFVDLVG